MGAASSNARTVVIPNTTGVIDISDDVVKRMTNGLPSKANENRAQRSSASDDGPSIGTGPSSYPNTVPPATAFYGEVPFTSMQVRQEKERELRENDTYWTNRLKALEANLKQTNQLLEKEYNEAVVDVKKRFATSAVRQQLPPCQDLKAKVIECYRANQHETLRCTNEVQLFTDCANLHRIQLLQQRVTAEESNQKQ
ncbi:MICOS complex subunit MIC19 [Anopheles cruzii]|uniref:MICOS complex subunit MIC19 n=1 Tax=Anopheles cruzii TaxID=68878 RepID=UPI0022EC81E7|nr:MICOS complex subunit MIC19 [Anopheles cruzii]